MTSNHQELIRRSVNYSIRFSMPHRPEESAGLDVIRQRWHPGQGNMATIVYSWRGPWENVTAGLWHCATLIGEMWETDNPAAPPPLET